MFLTYVPRVYLPPFALPRGVGVSQATAAKIIPIKHIKIIKMPIKMKY